MDLVAAMPRADGFRADVEQQQAGSEDRRAEVLGKLGAGADAFVVPDIDALAAKPADFRINGFRVCVRVAYENVGAVSVVGRKWLVQSASPNQRQAFMMSRALFRGSLRNIPLFLKHVELPEILARHVQEGPHSENAGLADTAYDTGTNQKSRLTGLNSTGANTTWTYDLQGRVLSKTQVSNGNTKTISYQYNSAGQLSQIV